MICVPALIAYVPGVTGQSMVRRRSSCFKVPSRCRNRLSLYSGCVLDQKLESQAKKSRTRTADCIFILAVIIVSAMPYLSGLGFYTDDWGFLTDPVIHTNHGFAADFRDFMSTFGTTGEVRPVQAVYLYVTLNAFGRHPLPYHLLGTALLGLTVVLLYFVLIELQTGRLFALSVSLIYGLLPHYSTDRFWMAAQPALLCVIFALLGIYAILRSIRAGTQHPRIWVALSITAFAFSLLSYEVALGLVFASLSMIGWRRYRELRNSPKRGFGAIAGVAITILVLLAVSVEKSRLQSSIGYDHLFLRMSRKLGGMAIHTVTQAIQFNLWTYCLHMPWAMGGLWRHAAITDAAIVSAAVVAIAVAAVLWRSREPAAIPGRVASLRLIALSFILFGLGFLFFAHDLDSNFSDPGFSNRVTIAAALGPPFLWVALVALACSFVTSPIARLRIFSVVIGLICGVNCLVVSGIGHFLDDSTLRQSAVFNPMLAIGDSLPRGSVFLLDEICRHSPPGILSETDYDSSALIVLLSKDDSLNTDAVPHQAQIGATGVDSDWNPGQHYSYGDRLFIYSAEHEYLKTLQSKEAADQYLRAMHPTGESGCPATLAWDSTQIF